MGAFYIYKTNLMVTAFSVAPTLTSINYVFSPEMDIEISIGDKVLIFKPTPTNKINIGLDIVSKNTDGSINFNKLFETSKGCDLAEIPSHIISSLNEIGENSLIEIAESDYISIVSMIFEIEIRELGGVTSSNLSEINSDIVCRQQIYYGAPGTGKSYEIENVILKDVDEKYVFRTTFHPDADYASFVGCYKPISYCRRAIRSDYTIDELAEILKTSYASATIKTKALHSFALEYVDYFNGIIASFNKKDLVLKADLSEDYKVEINKIVNLNQWMVENNYLSTTSNISYEFSAEVFTNAYVEAWNNPTNHIYLVIEEINRGNCAQIFGNLFQLLDRKNGVSEYPIKADAALSQYLHKKLRRDSLDGIKGDKLTLPANLSILATMNTSDQSLFPMDSAFKRRWDWEYIPIKIDDSLESAKFRIVIDKNVYLWHDFISVVNKKIEDITESADKQLGNFFIKGNIEASEFCSKVMFYLWTEVCKEAYKINSFFISKQDAIEEEFSFNNLYESKERRNELLIGFMDKLEVSPIDNIDKQPELEQEPESEY